MSWNFTHIQNPFTTKWRSLVHNRVHITCILFKTVTSRGLLAVSCHGNFDCLFDSLFRLTTKHTKAPRYVSFESEVQRWWDSSKPSDMESVSRSVCLHDSNLKQKSHVQLRASCPLNTQQSRWKQKRSVLSVRNCIIMNKRRRIPKCNIFIQESTFHALKSSAQCRLFCLVFNR